MWVLVAARFDTINCGLIEYDTFYFCRSFGTKINNAGISNADISNAGIIFIKRFVHCFLPNFVCGLKVYQKNSFQLYPRVIMRFSISCN